MKRLKEEQRERVIDWILAALAAILADEVARREPHKHHKKGKEHGKRN